MIMLFGLIGELEFRRRLMIVFELHVEMGDDLMRKMSSTILTENRKRKTKLRNDEAADQKMRSIKGPYSHTASVWSVDTKLKARFVELLMYALFRETIDICRLTLFACSQGVITIHFDSLWDSD